MKLKNIVVVVSAMLGTTVISYAADTASTDTTTTGASTTTASASTSFLTPFADTPSAITNSNDTWGPQDRTGQWYLGLGVNGLANGGNSKGSNSGWNALIGYNVNKYIGVQYNQFATYNGMFGGLAEGVLNLSNDTMFTPYALAGAGWGNLAGKATGAWDVGAGMKFEISRNVQATVDYRYIETMANDPITGAGQQPNAKASTNMIGGGLIWSFGGDDAKANTADIEDTGPSDAAGLAAVPTIDESKYILPQGIKQCEGNYNLTKDGVACYVVNGDHVTVYLDTKFAYDSDELNISGKSAIESFVKFVKSNNIKSVSVEGYASKKSDGQEYQLYNEKLSHNRAESVAAYMNSLGIDSSQITTTGFGYGNPLVPNTSKQNRDYNQRVQASITAPLKKENS